MKQAVLDIELCRTWGAVAVPEGYDSAHALLRWRSRPIGRVDLDVVDQRIASSRLWLGASAAVGGRLEQVVLQDLAGVPQSKLLGVDLSATIIVCTRDRTDDLARCLSSLSQAPARETVVMVVDNAPTSDATEKLCAGLPVTYLREPRKGLNAARAAGLRAARTDLVIFCDDDVTVDAGWADAMRAPFRSHSVGAVTGLVMPRELETEAQFLFERAGGFYRGTAPRQATFASFSPGAVGALGAGASMAFRRNVALELHLFDAELDAGTPALSGGDNYALYVVLTSGYTIVYNPDAVSWHRHRRTTEELSQQLHANSVGLICFALRCVEFHRDVVPLANALRWFLASQLRRGGQVWPARLRYAEFTGLLSAPAAYVRARAGERRARTARRPSARPA